MHCRSPATENATLSLFQHFWTFIMVRSTVAFPVSRNEARMTQPEQCPCSKAETSSLSIHQCSRGTLKSSEAVSLRQTVNTTVNDAAVMDRSGCRDADWRRRKCGQLNARNNPQIDSGRRSSSATGCSPRVAFQLASTCYTARDSSWDGSLQLQLHFCL